MNKMFKSDKISNYFTDGKIKRDDLIHATMAVAQKAKNPDKLRGTFRQDTILCGQSGIGKSHWIDNALRKNNVDYQLIRGTHGFLFLCAELMLTHYWFLKTRKNKNQKKVIVFDDCDTLFNDDEGLNALKEMSEKNGSSRKLSYNKIIREFNLNPEHLEILENYRPENGGHGFKIDCNDFIFVICTNYKLPTVSDAEKVAKNDPASRKANRYNSLAAVRRRFDTREYFLDNKSNFGLLGYVALYDPTFIPKNISKIYYQKNIAEVLLWIKNNWDKLLDRSLDTIVDMIYVMKEYPYSYNDQWEAKFLRSSHELQNKENW